MSEMDASTRTPEADAMYDALQIIVKDPNIRAHLQRTDIMALEQAQAAVEGYRPSLTFNLTLTDEEVEMVEAALRCTAETHERLAAPMALTMALTTTFDRTRAAEYRELMAKIRAQVSG